MEKLHANIVLEILGRPSEHVNEALKSLVMKLGSEQGIKIIEKTYHKSVPVKDSKNLFTAFAEVSLELDSLYNYLGILFAYMPAHIELVYPEKIILSNSDLNDLGNRLIQRLHDYDAITKRSLMEKDILVNKLQAIAPDILKQSQNPGAVKNNEIKDKKPTKKKSKNKLKKV